jgi:hypothetical protein
LPRSTCVAHHRIFQLSTPDVQGVFEIVAPYLADEWPDSASGDLELKLSPSCGNGKHLWGSFNFGIVTGIIRGGAPPITIGEAVAFMWRGHEQGEGEMQFGDDNKGTLTFLGDGKLYGTMEGGFMEKYTFTGVRTQGSQTWAAHVEEWKEQWRGMNASSYGAASVARWGGWCDGMDETEQPADSDTTSVGDASDNSEEISDEAY